MHAVRILRFPEGPQAPGVGSPNEEGGRNGGPDAQSQSAESRGAEFAGAASSRIGVPSAEPVLPVRGLVAFNFGETSARVTRALVDCLKQQMVAFQAEGNRLWQDKSTGAFFAALAQLDPQRDAPQSSELGQRIRGSLAQAGWLGSKETPHRVLISLLQYPWAQEILRLQLAEGNVSAGQHQTRYLSYPEVHGIPYPISVPADLLEGIEAAHGGRDQSSYEDATSLRLRERSTEDLLLLRRCRHWSVDPVRPVWIEAGARAELRRRIREGNISGFARCDIGDVAEWLELPLSEGIKLLEGLLGQGMERKAALLKSFIEWEKRCLYNPNLDPVDQARLRGVQNSIKAWGEATLEAMRKELEAGSPEFKFPDILQREISELETFLEQSKRMDFKNWQRARATGKALHLAVLAGYMATGIGLANTVPQAAVPFVFITSVLVPSLKRLLPAQKAALKTTEDEWGRLGNQSELLPEDQIRIIGNISRIETPPSSLGRALRGQIVPPDVQKKLLRGWFGTSCLSWDSFQACGVFPSDESIDKIVSFVTRDRFADTVGAGWIYFSRTMAASVCSWGGMEPDFVAHLLKRIHSAQLDPSDSVYELNIDERINELIAKSVDGVRFSIGEHPPCSIKDLARGVVEAARAVSNRYVPNFDGRKIGVRLLFSFIDSHYWQSGELAREFAEALNELDPNEILRVSVLDKLRRLDCPADALALCPHLEEAPEIIAARLEMLALASAEQRSQELHALAQAIQLRACER